MMDHLCKQMINEIGHVVVVTHALRIHEQKTHSHTQKGGQLRPILSLSRLKVHRGINFHQQQQHLSINERVWI